MVYIYIYTYVIHVREINLWYNLMEIVYMGYDITLDINQRIVWDIMPDILWDTLGFGMNMN